MGSRSRKAKRRKEARQTRRELHALKRAAHEARKEYRRLVRAQRDLPRTPHYSQSPHYSLPQSPHYSLPQRPHYILPQSPHYSLPQSPHYSLPQSPHYSLPQSPHHGQSPHYGQSADVKFASVPTEAEWKEARNNAVQPNKNKEKSIPDVGAYLKARGQKAEAARRKEGTAINAPNFAFNHNGKEIFATIAGGRNYKGKFQFQLFEIDRVDGEQNLIYDDLGWFDADELLKSTAGTPIGAWCADQVAQNCKAGSYPSGEQNHKRDGLVYVQSTLTKNK